MQFVGPQVSWRVSLKVLGNSTEIKGCVTVNAICWATSFMTCITVNKPSGAHVWCKANSGLAIRCPLCSTCMFRCDVPRATNLSTELWGNDILIPLNRFLAMPPISQLVYNSGALCNPKSQLRGNKLLALKIDLCIKKLQPGFFLQDHQPVSSMCSADGMTQISTLPDGRFQTRLVGGQSKTQLIWYIKDVYS